jgi:hypothetical protein
VRGEVREQVQQYSTPDHQAELERSYVAAAAAPHCTDKHLWGRRERV